MEKKRLFGVNIPDAIPSRHQYRKEIAAPIIRRFRPFVYGRKSPTKKQWEMFGNLLNHGDKLMDDVVEWMAQTGFPPGQRAFEQALTHGIDTLPDAPEPLRALFRQVEHNPTWLNETLLCRGQQFCQMTGVNSGYILREAGLLAGYQVSYLNKVLALTGALEKAPARRIAETAQWWCDCISDAEISRHGPGYRATLHVRLVHSLIRRKIIRHPGWCISDDGVPVNQVDMAATLHAFSTVFLLGIRSLGMPVRKEDSQAVMHLMRYIGFLLGIDNVLLCRTEGKARKHFLFISMSLISPDDTGKILAKSLCEEPFSRHYPAFPRLMAYVEHKKNLSLDVFFLGKKAMRALGLPSGSLPWFPVLRFPVNFFYYIYYCLGSPSQQRKIASAGFKKQLRWIKSLYT
jgi:hypothetical protein